MTPQEIELYRKVQKYRGEWKRYDRCWHPAWGYGTVNIATSTRMVVIFDEGRTIEWFSLTPEALLWLPPVWSDDERCLWAMVDWESWDLWVHEGGACSMFRKIEAGAEFSDYDYKNPIIQGATLPEALLRAIAAGKG